MYNSNKVNILSSSFISSQFLARHAIDENLETYCKSGMETDPYLKVSFEEPQKITKMKLQFKVEDSRYFTSLSIQGSNDEDVWTNLYTTTAQFTTLTEATLENIDYYKYYRLQCKSGDAQYFYVWEWQASEYIGVELVDYDINVEPYININQLGVKKINGTVRYGEKISLVYNGGSFDIIENYPKSSTALAQEGVNDSTFMTPLKVKQAMKHYNKPSNNLSIKTGTISSGSKIPQTEGYTNYIYFVSVNKAAAFDTITDAEYSPVYSDTYIDCSVVQSTRVVSCHAGYRYETYSSSAWGTEEGTANYVEFAWN